MQNLNPLSWPGSKPLAWVLLLFFVLLRFGQLESDPSFLKAISDIDDEAWWAAPALHYLKTGSWLINEQSGGFLLAPAYSYLLLCWFKIAGQTTLSIRILHLLFLLLSCIGIYRYLGKKYPHRIWILALFLSNFFFFDFSRIGFPENVQISILIWSLLAFRSWIQNPNPIQSVTLGALLSLLILLKVSILWFLPAFAFASWMFRPVKQSIPGSAFVYLSALPICLFALYFFGLYWPNRESFVQQSQWMALTFPNFSETFNLYRILYWLFHFIQVPFFQNPTTFIWMGLVVLKWNKEGWNPGPNLICLIGLVILNLLGDGSERRLVFFLIPLLFLIAESPNSGFKPLPLLVKPLLFMAMVGNVWCFWVEHLDLFRFGGVQSILAPSFLLAFLVWSIFFFFRNGIEAWPIFSQRVFVSVFFLFSFFWCWGALQVFTPLFSFSFLFILFSLAWAALLSLPFFVGRLIYRVLPVLCLVLGLSLQLIHESTPRNDRKNLGNKLLPLLENKVVAGPNLAFGMHIYGHFTPIYHSDITPGYESIYVPGLQVADFYLDVYPAYGKPHDALAMAGELVHVGRSVEEVFRDSIYMGANRQVVVVYDLRTPARWEK